VNTSQESQNLQSKAMAGEASRRTGVSFCVDKEKAER
jgi:hypothetical protein